MYQIAREFCKFAVEPQRPIGDAGYELPHRSLAQKRAVHTPCNTNRDCHDNGGGCDVASSITVRGYAGMAAAVTDVYSQTTVAGCVTAFKLSKFRQESAYY